MTYRILVTGSKQWNREDIIAQALEMASLGRVTHNLVLVSGSCPKGADRLSEAYATSHGWGTIERHPAKWIMNGKYNPRAGYIRNREMVDLGADLCVAFIKNGSPGSTYTKNIAMADGIHTITYEHTVRNGTETVRRIINGKIQELT